MPRKKSTPVGSEKSQWEDLQKKKETIIESLGKASEIRDLTRALTVEAEDDPLDIQAKEPLPRLLSGTALDRILSKSGGIEAGRTVLVYGYPETGKTQIAEAMAAEAENLIIYVDSEHTFVADRFKEICIARNKDPSEVSKRFRRYHPDDWMEQESIMQNLPEFDSDGNFLDVGIVVIDSIMKVWSTAREFHGRDKMTRRAQMIRAELADLASYVRRHNAVLLMTSHVYERPDAKAFSTMEQIVQPPGGPTLLHFPDYVILLRKGPGCLRFARLVGAINLPQMEIPFLLDTSGIRDIPDPAERMKAFEVADKYGTKFISGSMVRGGVKKNDYKRALEAGFINPEEAKEWLSEEEIAEVLEKIEKEKREGIKVSDIIKELTKEEQIVEETLEGDKDEEIEI